MKNENKPKNLKLALLPIIFLTFIGLGISNSLLGTSWPAISPDIGVPISWQSLIIVIIFVSATIGAAIAEKMLARFGTYFIVVLGFVLIILSIFIYAVTQSFPVLVCMGAVMGFGVGLEQSTGNGLVAKHYSAIAMSWLHCCYAIGCMLAPVILSYFIINETWRKGYQVAGSIEIAIIAVVLLVIPLWKLVGPLFPKRDLNAGAQPARVKSIGELFRVPGGTIIPIVMYLYCSFEVTIFYWTTSYLTEEKGMTAGIAAGVMIYFFVGQVIGRILSGYISIKFGDRKSIRVMMILSFVGAVLLVLSNIEMLPVVFMFLGIASGPMFPLLIHEVPSIVGSENAQGVIGIQLAAANFGTASVPLLLGIIAGRLGFWVFEIFLLVLIAAAIILKFVQDKKYKYQNEDIS